MISKWNYRKYGSLPFIVFRNNKYKIKRLCCFSAYFSFSWADLRPGEMTITVRDCRRPPVLRSSGLLRSFDWKSTYRRFKTVCPTCLQAVQVVDCLTLADGTDRLSGNGRGLTSNQSCLTSLKARIKDYKSVKKLYNCVCLNIVFWNESLCLLAFDARDELQLFIPQLLRLDLNLSYSLCCFWAQGWTWAHCTGFTIRYDTFVNCNWVVTRWQKYSTYLHTNNT